jgi:ABC-2 type transport system permease protein
MLTQQSKWRASARIIWAITAKDLIDALKNKNAISVLISALFIVAAYRFIPLITAATEPPNLLLYDASNSMLAVQLESSQVLNVYKARSQESMLRGLEEGEVPELGVVLPADFDRSLAKNAPPVLEGYVLFWISESKASELEQIAEAEIERLAGQPVDIQIQSARVYPTSGDTSLSFWGGAGIVYLIVMIGLTMIPHLMLEEKQTRTLDALLVSPANATHLVIAKALVGLFYSLLGAGIGLALFSRQLLHLEIAILATFLGALFAVVAGLALGIKIENRAQLTMWSWFLVLPLFIPVVLSLMNDLFPAWLVQATNIIPTVMAFKLLTSAFGQSLVIETTLLLIGGLVIWVAAGLLLVIWLMRRQEIALQGAVGEEPDQITSPSQRERQPLAPTALLTEKPASISPSRKNDQLFPHIVPGVTRPASGWQIIWTIAAKDIGEAIKNKVFISILIGAVFIVLANAALPLLMRGDNTPVAVVYEESRSEVIRRLADNPNLRFRLVKSEAEMEEIVAGTPQVLIGLVIPADFDRQFEQGAAIQLRGYAAHWAKAEEVSRLASFFEEQLNTLASGSGLSSDIVLIQTEGNRLYPGVDDGSSYPLMTALNLTVMILAIGAALVPLLIIEEKEAHTFEALLVSPAGFQKIIVAKAMAGASFCLATSVVVLLIYRFLFVQWSVVLLAILLGAAFAVAIGMLIGIVADNPTTLGLWGSIILLVLLAPALMKSMGISSISPLIQALIDWTPSTALIRLIRISMGNQIPIQLLIWNAGALVLSAALIYLLVGGLVRRSDRG